MIIAHKQDVVAYVASECATGSLKETREAFCHESNFPDKEGIAGAVEEWKDVEKFIVKEIQRAEHPAYGTDWSKWLRENIDDLAQEAIDIVM